MTRLSQLTLRNFLIAAHDALATRLRCLRASICASRAATISTIGCRCCCSILPYFVAFSVVVCYIFNLTTTKWRFISLPDALNILRVGDRLAVALVVLD